ncbi:unnamed protein product [marine sediment metagenome]|uniref:Uncharacterized protein n=1 Tax=marine sediment metagenome TaxID=412755 RepID=X0Y0S8_9ZZZZ
MPRISRAHSVIPNTVFIVMVPVAKWVLKWDCWNRYDLLLSCAFRVFEPDHQPLLRLPVGKVDERCAFLSTAPSICWVWSVVLLGSVPAISLAG